jgi:hypothetical protein
MRKYVLLGAVAALCSFTNGIKDDSGKVTNAANGSMQSMLSNIPVGSERQFGFTNREEIQSATAGYPYHMLGLSQDFFSNARLHGNLANYLTTGNDWRVPVTVNGDYRLLVTVTGEAGNYTTADIGGAGLAHELQTVGNRKKDHTYYILRIYPITADMVVDVPRSGIEAARFIPLTSARMAMPSLTEVSYGLGDALQAIKTAVTTRNLKN